MKASALGVTACGFVVLLIVGQLLTSAAGNLAPQLGKRHPRNSANFRPDSPHVGWKTPPATTPPAAPVVLALLIGLTPPSKLAVVGSDVSRPPFVPPRS